MPRFPDRRSAGGRYSARYMNALQHTRSMSTTTMPHVLLVEDHAATRMAMSRLLQSEGYRVELAGSLHDALSAAMRAAAGADPIDCLISDLRLGDGSGLDLVR